MFTISQTTLEINDRFFQAVDALKRKRLIGGLKEFASLYNANLGNLYTMKGQRSGAVKAEYLAFLVRDYGISSDWLLLGRGDMFIQMIPRTE